MGQTVEIDGQPINVDDHDEVKDLKYKAGVSDDKVVWADVDGEFMPLNEDDPVDIIDGNEASTMPGGQGDVWG